MDRKIQDREQTSFMGISDALLGKKNVDGTPWIESIEPGASLPGGAVRIIGRSLKPPKLSRPVVNFNGLKGAILARIDRKSTRLNSSHQIISYAVFCLKKKNNKGHNEHPALTPP